MRAEKLVLDKEKETTQWEKAKSIILNAFLRMSVNVFSHKVQEFQDSLLGSLNFTDHSALLSALPITRDFLLSNECLLTTTALKNNYKRKAIFVHVEVIKQDILTLSLMEGICTNITSNSLMQQRHKLTKLADLNRIIFLKLKQWVKSSLVETWPHLTEHYLRTFLAKSTETITDINGTSDAIRHEAESRGPEKYHHRVIIMQNDQVDGNIFYAVNNTSNERNCITLEGIRGGIHLFITRFDFESDIARARRANVWFKKRENELTNAMSDWHSANKNLTTVLREINWAVHGDLQNSSRYRNLILFRQATWLKTNCVFTTAISTVPIHGVHPTENVATVVSGLFDSKRTFRQAGGFAADFSTNKFIYYEQFVLEIRCTVAKSAVESSAAGIVQHCRKVLAPLFIVLYAELL
uniref:Uncharacterized protein n=1 Tax=Globodera rostochiensis TaxID=31243 RepID=A0A914HFY7_GLORO